MTPEQQRLLLGQLGERFDALLTGQPWVQSWLDQKVSDTVAFAEWIRSRPASVQAVLRRFPVYSLVRTKPGYSYMVPAQGTVGIAFSFFEDGSLSVLQAPDSEVRCQVDPDRLELVACVHGASVDDISVILGPEAPHA